MELEEPVQKKKKKKRRRKVDSFMCAFCGNVQPYEAFAQCDIVQGHVNQYKPRKRNPHCTGKCDTCRAKDRKLAQPRNGMWAFILRHLGFKGY